MEKEAGKKNVMTTTTTTNNNKYIQNYKVIAKQNNSQNEMSLVSKSACNISEAELDDDSINLFSKKMIASEEDFTEN